MILKFDKRELWYFIFEICILLSTITSLLSGYWNMNYSSYSFVSSPPLWSNLIKAVGYIDLFALSIDCFLRYNKKFPKKIVILDTCLIIYFVAYYLYNLFLESFSLSIISVLTPFIIVVPIIKYIGADSKFAKRFFGHIKFYTILFLSLSYVSYLLFFMQFGLQRVANAPHKSFYSLAITCSWIYCFRSAKESKKITLEIFIIEILLIIGAFIANSRAWVVHSFLILLITMRLCENKNQKGFKFIVGIILIVVLYFGISFVFPNLTNALINRLFDDSRSGQYVIFFNQINFNDLILGLGYYAGYTYLGVENYYFFDNQFIFLMLHYGIFPVFVLLLELLDVIIKFRGDGHNVGRIVGGLLLLCYLGFCIYYQFTWGLLAFIPQMLFGIMYAQTNCKHQEIQNNKTALMIRKKSENISLRIPHRVDL